MNIGATFCVLKLIHCVVQPKIHIHTHSYGLLLPILYSDECPLSLFMGPLLNLFLFSAEQTLLAVAMGSDLMHCLWSAWRAAAGGKCCGGLQNGQAPSAGLC